MPHTILVTAATGTQGLSTTLALLSANHNVHALVRSITSPTALNLQNAGAILFQGDFSSIPCITAAAQRCTHAFINVSPVFGHPGAEADHGRNIVEACKEAGVKKVVLSSVPGLDVIREMIARGDLNESLGYRKSKIEVERFVMEASWEGGYTVLQLPRLLSSFIEPLSGVVFPDLKTKGVIRTLLGGVKGSVLDPRDVGRVVACVMADEEGVFRDRRVRLEGERLTLEEVGEVMNEVLGVVRVRVEEIGEVEGREFDYGGGDVV